MAFDVFLCTSHCVPIYPSVNTSAIDDSRLNTTRVFNTDDTIQSSCKIGCSKSAGTSLVEINSPHRTSSDRQGVVQQHDNNFFVFQVSYATLHCSAKRSQALPRGNLSRDSGTNDAAIYGDFAFVCLFGGEGVFVILFFTTRTALLPSLKKPDADFFFGFVIGSNRN